MKGWFAIYPEEGLVVLDVFPYQPGGVTVKITKEQALWLAKQLQDAAKSDG